MQQPHYATSGNPSPVPNTALTITRWERDALHRACDLDLTAVGDVGQEWDQADFAGACELGQRFKGVFSLLDDLGWDPVDSRDRYELTTTGGLLGEWLSRQLSWAKDALMDRSAALSLTRDQWEAQIPAKYRDGLLDYDEERAEAHTEIDTDLDLIAVCESLLERMGQAPTEQGVAA
jgi:hypothetical protein